NGNGREERHIRRNGDKISGHAAEALRRGAPQDGLFHACNGASSDSSVGAGSRAIGIAFFIEEGSLSPFLRTRFRYRDAQKNSSRARKGVSPTRIILLHNE